MLTYNMDVEPRSQWLRTTPGALALAQPFYCTEAGRFYGRGQFSTARTDKESYILFYTRRGAGLIEQNSTQVLLPEGQALLLNCRTPQSYCTAPGQPCWHHDWVHLDGAGVRALEELLIPGRLCPLPISPALLPEFDTVLSRLEQSDAASVVAVGLALHTLLAGLAAVRLESTAPTGSRALIGQTADYIRTHYAEELDLDKLLQIAPMSKSHFLRVFREQMGTTPYNFLLCTRMTQAKELLVMTDLSVGAVAARVGFSSESNFSARFSAMTGQSPLQYRKSIANRP